jgi:diguanylate cyclase (GGDEF)-like protein
LDLANSQELPILVEPCYEVGLNLMKTGDLSMPHKPTILIVAKDQTELQPLMGPLGEYSSPIFFSSGKEALNAAEEMTGLDLLLLSFDLPGEDSLEICSQFKAQETTRLVPVLFLGHEVNNENKAKGLRAGAAGFVSADANESSLAKIKLHLELKFKTDLLTEIALLDGLTSIPNKERFDEYLDLEWRRSLREFNTLTLIYVDIDNFTAFNDGYGLSAGDECLKRIAKLMQANCLRAADMVGRYGGDEFIALLPGTELDNGMIVAEKMIAAVKALNIENKDSNHGRITLSVGLVNIDPSMDNKPSDLINEAEEMLNQAQLSGGDQVQAVTA